MVIFPLYLQLFYKFENNFQMECVRAGAYTGFSVSEAAAELREEAPHALVPPHRTDGELLRSSPLQTGENLCPQHDLQAPP